MATKKKDPFLSQLESSLSGVKTSYQDSLSTLFPTNNYLESPQTNYSGSATQYKNPVTNTPITAKMTNQQIMNNNNAAKDRAKKESEAKRKKETTFSGNQIYNSFGNYSKSNAAAALGISKDELARRAKAAGYKDTQSYYESLKSAPKKSAGLLGGIVPKVYAETPESAAAASTAPNEYGLKWNGGEGYGVGNWGTNEYGVTENAGKIASAILSPNPLVGLVNGFFSRRGTSGDTGSIDRARTGVNNNLLFNAVANPNTLGGGSIPTASVRTGSGEVLGAGDSTLGGGGGINQLSALEPTGGEGTTETTTTEPYAKMIADATGAQENQIDAIISQYEQLKADAENQLGYVTGQYGLSKDSIQNQVNALMNQIDQSKANAQSTTDSNIQQAYETANSTQRANRNVLRALGILGSSAAGDILSRPGTEADKEAGKQRQALTGRLAQLEDAKVQNQSEATNQLAALELQFNKLTNDIQNDIRFNAEQRQDAINQAYDAYNQRVSDIELASQNWNNTIEQQKLAYSSQLAQILAYSNPSSVQGILGSLFKV